MNFDNLTELNASRCVKEKSKFKRISDYQLVSNRPLVLDKSFDLYALNDFLFDPSADSFHVTFQNMLGIDLNFYGYKLHEQTKADQSTKYTVIDSTFDFYLNNEIIFIKSIKSFPSDMNKKRDKYSYKKSKFYSS
jgi:hypothetical protein